MENRMSFSKLMDTLFTLKRDYPDMAIDPEAEQWGGSKVVITIPVEREHAELLIQAVQMFAPKADNWMAHQELDEPPF